MRPCVSDCCSAVASLSFPDFRVPTMSDQTINPHAPRDAVPTWTDVQWDAVSSPHRTQLLSVIDGVGRATIKELSEWTGRTGPSLYPHLEILEKAQFLTVEFETKKGRAYRVYCAGPALKWRSTAHGSADTGGRAIKLAVQLLNDVILRLRRWGKVREGTPIERGAHASAKLIAETTWLDDEQREELNRRVADLMAFVRQARAERRGARHTVTIYHFPDVTLRAVREHRQAKELGQG